MEARRAAFQYDLVRMGKTLDIAGTHRFPWDDVILLARRLQFDPSSALATEIHGRVWSIEAQLLADVVDLLAIANWQRQGKKSAKKPKPVERPWRKPKSTRLGSQPIPISQFNDWWDSTPPEGHENRG